MFYILRHGRTDWNEEHRLQGEVDIPLNETGRQMAYDAAEKYKDIDFDICYCSPLKRAQETARIFLADRNPAVEIITDNRLHEMCFGDYEGVKNIRQKPECPVYLLFEEPEKYVAKDGAESFEELYHRTGEFIEQVLRPQLEAGKNVLVVIGLIKLGSFCYDFGYRVFTEGPVEEEPGTDVSVDVTDDLSEYQIGKLLKKEGLIRDAA